MIITDGEKTMTLRELALRICNSYDDKDCDECPAKEHCHTGHNGGEYDENGVWKPNKQGLGMGHVFDEMNKIYGDGFIKY